MSNQVIVVGGGLAGLSAAHTVLERGGRVVVIDKNPFLGGNSTKATSGINGALTRTQMALGIKDSPDQFLKDTAISASKGQSDAPYPLAKVLTYESAPAVHWLQDSFNLDLSLISRLGGHSFPRTHRGKEKFPGMTITYALMQKLEQIVEDGSGRARILIKCKVEDLIKGPNGEITGVEYTDLTTGSRHRENGPVVIATGGYGADFTENSILKKVRPDICHLPTTNGDHCTGDGIKMSEAVGAAVVDITAVQVHPTGLVHPDDPDAKVKFLAAEALRGCGGVLIDKHGNRFCNELGRRDYVSEQMWKNEGPFMLLLNSKASQEIEWHCKHYVGRGIMRRFENGRDVAKALNIAPEKLEDTFKKYNEVAESGKCPFGKKYFHNLPLTMNEFYHVAQVTPVIHYCMGGLKISPAAEVMTESGVIEGLYATGEVCGGVHGQNRLGGSSLLDCVVLGRVAGDSVARYLLSKVSGGAGSGPFGANVQVDPNAKTVTVSFSWGEGGATATSSQSAQAAPNSGEGAPAVATPDKAPKAPADPSSNKISPAEVSKHNTESDCWVIVNGRVLNVTEFLPDHPGGKKAILLYAGKDASEEFNMLHEENVIDKYAPKSVIGVVGASGTENWKVASRL